MPELQLALIAIGFILVIGVYLYSRWQEEGRRGHQDREHELPPRKPTATGEDRPARPRRPRLDPGKLPDIKRRARRVKSLFPDSDTAAGGDETEAGSLEDNDVPDQAPELGPSEAEGTVPAEEAAPEAEPEGTSGEMSGESPEEIPDSGPEPGAELGDIDPDEQKIVVLHVIASEEEGLPGAGIREILESEGCRHGHYNIFHRSEQGDDGRPGLVFSVADLVEPGEFDLEQMDQSGYRGLTLFSVLPGPLPGVEAFRLMQATARRVADELGGELRDEVRNPLSMQRATHIEEEITEFERLRLQALRARLRGK